MRVANGLVKSACDQVPVRLLNPSSDSKVVYKGTKIATVEEIDDKPHGAVLAVQPENKGVSSLKRQMLGTMVEECASNLAVDQKEQFFQLYFWSTLTSADEGELGRTDRITHSIDTGSAPPIRQPVRRVPVCQRKELKELLTDMEEKDVIRPSSSHWASPIVLVKKRDGTH